jgi:hypothetical protein
MTWSLSASGHTPVAAGATDSSLWKRNEQKLLADLRRVLSKPEYGTHSSYLTGNFVAEPAHLPSDVVSDLAARTRHPATAALLGFFDASHLPDDLAEVSGMFGDLARDLADRLPDTLELTVALRKLLEGKDAAVRAAVDMRSAQSGQPAPPAWETADPEPVAVQAAAAQPSGPAPAEGKPGGPPAAAAPSPQG